MLPGMTEMSEGIAHNL